MSPSTPKSYDSRMPDLKNERHILAHNSNPDPVWKKRPYSLMDLPMTYHIFAFLVFCRFCLTQQQLDGWLINVAMSINAKLIGDCHNSFFIRDLVNIEKTSKSKKQASGLGDYSSSKGFGNGSIYHLPFPDGETQVQTELVAELRPYVRLTLGLQSRAMYVNSREIDPKCLCHVTGLRTLKMGTNNNDAA